jgi:hypothetical protein
MHIVLFRHMKKSFLTLLLLCFSVVLYAQSGPETAGAKSEDPVEKDAARQNGAVKAVPSAKGTFKPERIGSARGGSVGAARAVGAARPARAVRPAARPVAPGRGR